MYNFLNDFYSTFNQLYIFSTTTLFEKKFFMKLQGRNREPKKSRNRNQGQKNLKRRKQSLLGVKNTLANTKSLKNKILRHVWFRKVISNCVLQPVFNWKFVKKFIFLAKGSVFFSSLFFVLITEYITFEFTI